MGAIRMRVYESNPTINILSSENLHVYNKQIRH